MASCPCPGACASAANDAWELRVYLGRDPISGKPTYRSRSFRGTKRQAQQELARLSAQALDGNLHEGKGSGQTFGQLVEQWFTSWSPEWSPGTAAETRRIIDTKLVGLSRARLDRITPASLDIFYAELRTRGGRDGGPLAQSSVRRIHAVVSSAFEQAVRWGWLTANPAQRAWRRKGKGNTSHEPKSVPSVAEVVALLQAARDAGEWGIASLLELEVHTGVRRGERLALRWSDLDTNSSTLRVSSAIVTSSSGVVERPATKTGIARSVLSDEAVAVLDAHRRRSVERAEAEGVSLARDAYIFSPAADGSRPWWPSSVSRKVRLLCERLGVPAIRLQELRRLHSSLLIIGGVDMATEMERLGHGATVALRDYVKSNRLAHERAAKVVTDALAAQAAIQSDPRSG